MPYGVSMGYFVRYCFCAFMCTAAGAQAVHLIYRPDLSIPDHIVNKGELHTKLFASNIQKPDETIQTIVQDDKD